MGDFDAPIHTVELGDSLNKDALLSLVNNDLILNALDCSFTPEFTSELTDIIEELSTKDHSLILVALPEQYSNLPEDWIVVPSLGEAMDFIEMERIERDLGF